MFTFSGIIRSGSWMLYCNTQIQRSPHTASVVQISTSRLSSNGHIMFVKGTIRLEQNQIKRNELTSQSLGALTFFCPQQQPRCPEEHLRGSIYHYHLGL